MGTSVMVGILCSVFSVLITFLVTTIFYRGIFATMIQEAIVNHSKELHQASVFTLVEKHAKECTSHAEINILKREVSSIKTALIFLVVKQDGDPKSLGLID